MLVGRAPTSEQTTRPGEDSASFFLAGGAGSIALAIVLGAIGVVYVVRWVLMTRVPHPWAKGIAAQCGRPAYIVAATVAAKISLSQLPALGPGGERISLGSQVLGGNEGWVQHALLLVLIASSTWLGIGAVLVATNGLLRQLELEHGRSNVRVRKARTQVLLVQRVVVAIGAVVAFGAMLFTWQQVRVLGAGLLASASVAGIIIGIAAQRAIGNLFSGLQLAFSDMLHVDDVVVVEGEWGEIEELTLSYVVVRIWDSRRLVLPVSYFTTTPFENWTKEDNTIIGTVFLRLDWSVPVDGLREYLGELLAEHPRWDGKEWSLVVTDVLHNGLIEVRASMSAADGYASWYLNCDVREKLVAFVRENHPASMPRMRSEIIGAPGLPAEAAVPPVMP